LVKSNNVLFITNIYIMYIGGDLVVTHQTMFQQHWKD